ncbi:phospholipid carrier-dependent glycosyltransferase [Clavibacter michiganensis]|nr:phospholipid carrier-dependent glycosyltransferase [Clavibacter michiganensis]
MGQVTEPRTPIDFDETLAAQTELQAPAQPEPTGSRLDEWWGRLLSTPGRQRLWAWGGPIAVTLLAAILRLVNLGHPHSLVFDETFYVKDSYTTLRNGYESTWPADADEAFNAGDTDGFLQQGSFAVHPPLGKWVIALGLAVFGADSSVGWRISVAVCGILLVLLTTLVAKKLFRSTFLATVAGFLIAIDGHAIVMSRVALLDGIFALVALAGVGAVLMDREWHARRLDEKLMVSEKLGRVARWGPALWWRPWVLAAGILFGLASSVKWSGLYFLAAFAVYLVVVDALARRRAGLPLWAAGAILKQGPVTFLLTVPIAIIAYLSTWSGWFLTSGGMYRQWVQTSGEHWTGPLAWVPNWAQNFWHLEAAVYNYHVNEHTPHPYQANPFSWLFLIRPTQMYIRTLDNGQGGCGADTCYENITSIANPIIWWAGTAALLYLVFRLIRKREWVVGFILMGMVAGYLPWLLYVNRTIYQFYTIAFEPYLILGLVFVIGLALGRRTDPRWMRVGGVRAVIAFLIICSAVTVFFYPVWTAQEIPGWLLSLHYWLPTWR